MEGIVIRQSEYLLLKNVTFLQVVSANILLSMISGIFAVALSGLSLSKWTTNPTAALTLRELSDNSI
jgi:hypothetical protein